MVRETSIEAYHDAQVQGLIRKNEMVVIEVAHERWRNEGHTTKELMELVGIKIGANSWNRLQDFQKVVKPLKDKGVLEELEKRPCEITGRNAYPVRLSYKMPVKIDHNESEKAVLRKTVKEQAEKIKFLEGSLSEARNEIRRLQNGELF